MAALSNNLNEDNEQGDFEKRARIMELGLKAKDIAVKEKDSEKQCYYCEVATVCQGTRHNREESHSEAQD